MSPRAVVSPWSRMGLDCLPLTSLANSPRQKNIAKMQSVIKMLPADNPSKCSGTPRIQGATSQFRGLRALCKILHCWEKSLQWTWFFHLSPFSMHLHHFLVLLPHWAAEGTNLFRHLCSRQLGLWRSHLSPSSATRLGWVWNSWMERKNKKPHGPRYHLCTSRLETPPV